MARKQTLQQLKNIGPAMEKWLHQTGITTAEQLQKIGAVEAYVKIRTVDRNAANKMALYALYGAIHNEDCIRLAPEVKEMLNEMLESQ